MKTFVIKSAIIILFISSIFFPKLVVFGATTGVNLCLKTVFPCLFPAMVITKLLQYVFSKKNGNIFSCILGTLCGYPIGACFCSEFKSKNPSSSLPDKIMAFCNISSPSFVINFIWLTYLGDIMLWKILIINYLPVIILLAFTLIHNKSNINHAKASTDFVSLSKVITGSITDATKSALILCGYIIFFSCISNLVSSVIVNMPILQAFLSGIIEITSGINCCKNIPSINLRCIIIMSLNSFGGISTLMQTQMIVVNSKISIKKYIHNKLILTALTLLISVFVVYVL